MSARRAGERVVGRASRGMTLVELLMAMSIAGLIGAALAAMLSSVARGTSDANDARGLATERPRLAARLGAAVREARAVLLAEDGRVLLWMRDADDDGQPALDELELVTLDAATSTLSAVRADPAASDTVYALSADFASVIDDDLLDGEPVTVAWSDAVEAFVVEAGGTPPDARTVSYRMTLRVGPAEDTLVGTLALRTEAGP